LNKASFYTATATLILSAASLTAVLLGFNVSVLAVEYQILLCVFSGLFVFLPPLLEKIFNAEIHEFIKVFLHVYVICGMILGNVFNFYCLLPFWDKLLHGMSGVLFLIMALILINQYTKKGCIKLNGAFTVIATLIFAVAMGTLWEFIEYIMDGIFKDINMQRYMTRDGTMLIGREALNDTMLDMIFAAAGAVITCIIATVIKNKREN
jgi:hypothetical protein